MCGENFMIWGCVLLFLIISLSKSGQISADEISIAATDDKDDGYVRNKNIIKISSQIASISFLMSTCVVYSILSELRNAYGFILCNYTIAMSIEYIINIVHLLIKKDTVDYSFCIINAFFGYFCFLASCFWLIVMSFHVCWTFREFNLLQRNVRREKRQEKRQLVFYAIFAWGLSFTFAIIAVIIDVYEYPKSLRPRFRKGGCWFYGLDAIFFYMYWPETMCIMNNICSSIYTANKIAWYEYNIRIAMYKTCNHLMTDSESKRFKDFKDNKKWLIRYLKLSFLQFIMMTIKWYALLWLDNPGQSYSFLCAFNLLATVPNFCIFVMFVWKKNIRQMLLKRFGCGLFSKDCCATNETSSNTSSCITSGDMSMQKEMISCV